MVFHTGTDTTDRPSRAKITKKISDVAITTSDVLPTIYYEENVFLQVRIVCAHEYLLELTC